MINVTVDTIFSPLAANPRDDRILVGRYVVDVEINTKGFRNVSSARRSFADKIKRELEALGAKGAIIVGRVALTTRYPCLNATIQINTSD